MTAETPIRFDDPDLGGVLESLPEATLHGLPFGVVRLDEERNVIFYSESEGRLSGHGIEHTVGRKFFTELAPCFQHPGFLGRLERARQRGVVDIEFGWVGDFDDAKKALRVRILSASWGGVWVLIARS